MDSQNLRKGLQGKADQRLACGFPRRGIFRDFSRLGSILRLRIFVGWETMIGSQAQIRGAWSRRPRYGRSGEAPGRLHASSPSSRSMTRRDSTHDRPATPGMDMTGWATREATRPWPGRETMGRAGARAPDRDTPADGTYPADWVMCREGRMTWGPTISTCGSRMGKIGYFLSLTAYCRGAGLLPNGRMEWPPMLCQ